MDFDKYLYPHQQQAIINKKLLLFRIYSDLDSLTDDTIQYNIIPFINTKTLGIFSRINNKFNILTQVELKKKNESWLWDKVTDKTIVFLIEEKQDWSCTKYYKKGNKNKPLDYFSNDEIIGIWKTIPGIIADIIFSESERVEFDLKKEYGIDEIYEISGGRLLNVVMKTDDTIQVTYIQYDHSTEPIYSDKFKIVKL